MTTNYAVTGETIQKTTVFDDGIQQTDTFSAGALAQRVSIDTQNAKSWFRIETNYAADGQITQKSTIVDGGLSRIETFEDGQRVSLAQTDAGNQKNWDTQTTTYDATGVIMGKTTTFDNGVFREDVYGDGALRFSLQEDLEDVFQWQTIVTANNPDVAGQSMRRTEYDDGDQTAHLFLDGTQVLRVELDGDDDQPWLVRATNYAGNTPVVETYDTLADVPQDYLDLLDVEQLTV